MSIMLAHASQHSFSHRHHVYSVCINKEILASANGCNRDTIFRSYQKQAGFVAYASCKYCLARVVGALVRGCAGNYLVIKNLVSIHRA